MPTAFLASLRPFEDNLCPACGGTCPTFRFCEHLCRPGLQGHGTDGFISRSQTYDPSAPHYPHLHKFCAACRYEWVSQCKTAVARLQ